MRDQQEQNRLTLFVSVVLIFLSVVALIYPALLNGYPLLYSDSATYIASGHDHFVPIDRPIFYGLFVWNTSFGLSLWTVIVVQAAIVLSLIYYTYSLFVKNGRRIYYTFLTVLILSLFTGLPNYVSQIMPDLFSGIMIWLVVLFYFSKTKKSRIVLGVGLLFSSIVHNSNLLTLTLLVSLLLLVSLIGWLKEMRHRSVVLFALLVGTWFFVPSVNFLFTHEWYLSKGGNVFFMGRLIESGIVKEYLDEECADHNYDLCKYKDNLPKHGYEFCWNDDSPLYDGGCKDSNWVNCWIAKNDEYKAIITDILTTPKYLKEFVGITIHDLYRQFFYFDMIFFSKLEQGTGLDSVVEHFMKDHPMLLKARQMKETLFYSTQNLIQRYFIGLSTLFILVWVAYSSIKRRTNQKDLFAISILVLGLIINAAIVSTFSMVECRYQGRLIWLLPFFACLLIAEFVESKRFPENRV